jgi:hypothetical protein
MQTEAFVEMIWGGAMLPGLSQTSVGVRLVRTWGPPE